MNRTNEQRLRDMGTWGINTSPILKNTSIGQFSLKSGQVGDIYLGNTEGELLASPEYSDDFLSECQIIDFLWKNTDLVFAAMHQGSLVISVPIFNCCVTMEKGQRIFLGKDLVLEKKRAAIGVEALKQSSPPRVSDIEINWALT